jgi:hypothetical protein
MVTADVVQPLVASCTRACRRQQRRVGHTGAGNHSGVARWIQDACGCWHFVSPQFQLIFTNAVPVMLITDAVRLIVPPAARVRFPVAAILIPSGVTVMVLGPTMI